jgi:oxygen-independent coproporphyrinogen III oxidase
MLELGVNRLSIGAQSLDPNVLKTLGRTHSVSAIEKCFRTARQAGFKNINLDLIFGVPGQEIKSWVQTLENTLGLQPQHISCYGLTFEEDTDFFKRQQRNELQRDDKIECEMFHEADRILTHAGFKHYEISNYSLPGFESRHNLAYWRGNDYHGIGPSAVTTVRGIRKTNSKFNGLQWKLETEENLTPEIQASERMALGLRTEEGVELKEFERKFGFTPEKQWGKVLQMLSQNNLLIRDSSLKLTPRGREVADEIATYFV